MSRRKAVENWGALGEREIREGQMQTPGLVFSRGNGVITRTWGFGSQNQMFLKGWNAV